MSMNGAISLNSSLLKPLIWEWNVQTRVSRNIGSRPLPDIRGGKNSLFPQKPSVGLLFLHCTGSVSTRGAQTQKYQLLRKGVVVVFGVTFPKWCFDRFDSVKIHVLKKLDFIVGFIVIGVFVGRTTPNT